MNLKNQIDALRGDAAGLERLYKSVLDAGNAAAFKSAMEQCAGEHPEDVLFAAWAYRLGILPVPHSEVGAASQIDHRQSRRWWIAILTSVILGLAFALFAGDLPPVPVPGEADPLFWLGWAPLIALGILDYLALNDRSKKRTYFLAGLAMLPIAVYTAATAWNRTGDVAALIALHLPFVAWAVVGAALALRHPQPARQCYAYFVKSVETVLVGAIYFGVGAMFVGLTLGIFAVLGVNIQQQHLQTVAAWGIGAIPVLALASVYDPLAAPVAQDWNSGLTRILRIITQFILPLTIGVLLVYVFWFVPAYFWRPFQERDVLIIYNATILAVLVLLTVVVSGPTGERSPRQDTFLRYGVLVLVGLILFLNIYALVAMTSRLFNYGLTPNRYAAFGWNIVTLLMLAVVVFRQWKNRAQPWIDTFRESIARVSVLAAAWALWVLIGLPLAFD